MGFMAPPLRCCGKERKRGGVWAPCRLVFDAPGMSGNEAVCEHHAASSSTPQEGVETRQRVDSTPPRLRCKGKEKRGGIWFPCRLVVDAARRRGSNEAACGFHATSLGSGLLPGPGCSPRPNPPLFRLLTTGCWVGQCRGSMGEGDGGG